MTIQAFNVLIIGAGNVNFGSAEGPWCHTTRLERKLGARLNVVGLVDPDVKRAAARLAEKVAAGVHGYQDTVVFPSIAAAGQGIKGIPQMALLGVQPSVRGSTKPGQDAELQLKKHFPQTAIFVEKPISASTLEDVQDVAAQLGSTRTSVGYMLRYLEAVTHMQQLIKENNLTIMSTIATYFMAYEFAGTNARAGYFDKTAELGPIVGQATHIVDLCRFFCGEVDLDSVLAVTVEGYEKPGALSRLLFEDGIKEENRIPRITNALWKWTSGATGTLVHAVALHGEAYDTELTILADGWKLKLVDPYGVPRLYVRRPGSDVEEETIFKSDDPFYSEVSCFIDVIEGGAEPDVIRSSYADAIKTYELTWAIRLAGEASASRRRVTSA
ncbi:hypothetical protein EHS25_008128 [Saitozyma podzolica]|uniref:Gfo/Idh/MocA-like oxidoreductase N-terminal domain-containing protein n=1 Tax=Saitozyma podzolica TaxID=1890683 RepID=A0A427YNN0_9TREE|nr:hypothetical protein EHS25_008128 [Saitozyma podzolica]